MGQAIYVVDGARTPFLKAQKGPGPLAASDLATQAGRALLLRQPFAPEDLDEVILGCAAPSPDETNIGRMVALRLGCGQKVPGWTVMRNCASGMQAIDSAIADIQRGKAELVLAGGVDALSRAPLLYRYDGKSYGRQQLSAFFEIAPGRAADPGDRPDEGPDRSGRRPADGPDGREPGLEVRHRPPADGRIRRQEPSKGDVGAGRRLLRRER